jgi:hypothetical protein
MSYVVEHFVSFSNTLKNNVNNSVSKVLVDHDTLIIIVKKIWLPLDFYATKFYHSPVDQYNK